PPGTGDVPLTVFQSLPIKGIIVVTSPQDLVSMIVEKAVNMAKMMNIPVLGLVENMSYFVCDNCNTRHYLYGKGALEQNAKKYNVNNVLSLPIMPEVASGCDDGAVEKLVLPEVEEFFDKIAKQWTK
ncbi:MAG: P-loop NTPase, partial [Clostridia bacterium]|nr:P-loop NTPase [Clostridia bacterium]